MSDVDDRKEVLIRIYTDLQEAWLICGELTKCFVLIDVSMFEEPVSEWVKVINRNLHFYNCVQYKIRATCFKVQLFEEKEFLRVELLDVPEMFTGAMEA